VAYDNWNVCIRRDAVMKKYITLIIITVIILIIALTYYLNIKSTHSESTILVSGNIEVTEIRLSFQVAGKIKQLLVDEGNYVKKGRVLAMLDNDELIKIKEQAQANLEQAQSDYNIREKDYIRYSELLKENAVSLQVKDIAQNNFEVAKAKLDAAKKALELANIRLSFANLASTIDGFVIVKSAEAGEVVQAGTPVFTVADMNDIWLTAYIKETDLGRVCLNQSVDVKTDSYPDKIYKGKISFISEESEFTPKYIQTTEERVKLVYRIKIDVNNQNFELKPGMPAEGCIME
jgi:HlyD family secretion protein